MGAKEMVWKIHSNTALDLITSWAKSKGFKVRWVVNWEEKSEQYVRKYVPHAWVRIEQKDNEVVVYLSY